MLIKFVNRLVNLEELLKRNIVSIYVGPSLFKNPETNEYYPAIWISMDEIQIDLNGKKKVVRDIIDCACRNTEETTDLCHMLCNRYHKEFGIFDYRAYIETLKSQTENVEVLTLQ